VKHKFVARCIVFAETEGLLDHLQSHRLYIWRQYLGPVVLHVQTTNRKSYMTYEIAAILMTLSDLPGLSSRFKLDFFSYSCVAVDKISTNIERRAVPLQ